MTKAMQDKVGFIAHIIPEFAAQYKMGVPSAYQYLKKYGGLDFLNECWWALHTDSTFWAVRSLYKVCYQHGGMR